MVPYKPYIPKDISAIMNLLGLMMLSSPTFVDKTGYFPYRSIDTVFFSLNEGLKVIRSRLGEENYVKLAALSDKMQALFRNDPNNDNGDTTKGCECILEMEDILRAAGRRRK